MRLGVQAQQQVEFFGEQRLIVFQRKAEQREGLDERASPGHQLGTAIAEQVQRGEVLEQAHRVGGAEDAHRAVEPDAARGRGQRAQHHAGGRDGVVRAVVFAHPEHVQARLIGQPGRGHQFVQALPRGGRVAGAGGQVAKGVDTDFHVNPGSRSAAGPR
jgi:hypothetical protein